MPPFALIVIQQMTVLNIMYSTRQAEPSKKCLSSIQSALRVDI